MKIYKVLLPGAEEKLIVANNEQEAFDRRAEVDLSYDYLPVEIKELEIEGYKITVKPIKPPEKD